MRYLLASTLAWTFAWTVFLIAERVSAHSWTGIGGYGEMFRIYSLGFAAVTLLLGTPVFFALRRLLSSTGFRIGALVLGLALGVLCMLLASLLTTAELDWGSFVRPRADLLRLEVLFVTSGLALGLLVPWLDAFAPGASRP